MNSAPQAGLKYYATDDHKVVEFEADPQIALPDDWHSRSGGSYEKEFTFDTRLRALWNIRSELTGILAEARRRIKSWHDQARTADQFHPDKAMADRVRDQCRAYKQAAIKSERETMDQIAEIEAQIAKEST